MIRQQLHLGLFIYPGGNHIGGWRHPAMPAQTITQLDYYCEAARLAEQAKFDLFFVGDMLAARERGGRVFGEAGINNLDSISIVSAIAGVTEHLGLVATQSSTYSDPVTIAAKFATLDYVSGGRSGWNVVTTLNDAAATNFGRPAAMEKSHRYARAREFVAIVTALWDNVPDFKFDGAYLHSSDPVALPPSPQGRPVLVQAGSSPDGMNFAATVAEVIFTAQDRLDDACAFRAGIHMRARACGRDPEQIAIMPGLSPILGDTEGAALRKEEELADLVHPTVGTWMLSEATGFALDNYPLDAKLPVADMRKAARAPSRHGLNLMDKAEREGMTLRAAARLIARARAHQSFVGTPEQLVDLMDEWRCAGACDGFNIMPPFFPDEWRLFVEQVTPLLVRRGLFRRTYRGPTLRDQLGLSQPNA